MTDVPPLLTKCCTKCGEWKPLTAFHADRSAAGWRKAACAECSNSYSVNKRRLDPEWHEREKKRKRERARERRVTDPEWHEREKARDRARREDPEFRVKDRIRNARNHGKRTADPRFRQDSIARSRLARLRARIAIETCKRLGIDLTKLAKEQYDAEQRAKQTEQGVHQDQGSPAEDLRTAEGRSGAQAGRRRTRAAGVVPGA